MFPLMCDDSQIRILLVSNPLDFFIRTNGEFFYFRYYYSRRILEPVNGRRLVYKFGDKSTGWRHGEKKGA